jgi:UDP-2,3-diacylglucosamine hydrolase
MRRVFLSDVHLTPREPERSVRFVRFLEREAASTDEFFILGDLFDYWIGPKHLRKPDYREAIQALHAATEAGLRATFLLGNRDFYMEGFTEATGVAVAPGRTEHEIAAGGKHVYLCHGEYLEGRRGFWIGVQEFIRSRGVERVYTRLPACLAKAGARFYRWVSEGRFLPGKPKPRRAVVLSEALLEERFRNGADVIVCGHVHRAERRDFFIDGRAKTLFTLGDWADRPNWLVEDDGDWRLSEAVGA